LISCSLTSTDSAPALSPRRTKRRQGRPRRIDEGRRAAEQLLGGPEIVERRADGGEPHHRVGQRRRVLGELGRLPVERGAEVAGRRGELARLRLERSERDEDLGAGAAEVLLLERHRLPEGSDRGGAISSRRGESGELDELRGATVGL
jgi:hypothetical protein